MDVKNLKLFVQVAEAGSFAAVARHENLDPSLVSRSIASLEQSLGFRLFHRSTRKLALTTTGMAYYQRVEPILDDLDQAEEAARNEQGEAQGMLALTASTAFGKTCILPHVEEFQRRYPHVVLDLHFTDAVVDIVAEQIDIACRLGSTADPNLVARKLFKTRFWLCASADYLANHPAPETPEAVAEHPLLACSLPGYRERWLFKDAAGAVTRLPLRPRILATNALAMKDMVMRGLGLGLLASWLAAREIEEGRLVRLLPDYQVSATDFESAAWLLYPSRRYLPNKTRVMLDFLQEKLADVPAH